jgi:tRNA/tmRNA/rRNA uracil-C5-methylase (TrmA/RlmC/RlmD family)
VVVPLVRQGLFDVGYRYTNEEVHTMLKEMFWKVEKVNEKTGEIKMITGSTTQMTTVDKMDYLEQIIQWAAEFLGVIIPAPGEQTNIEFE